jgi:hypothetical protein
VEWCWQLGQAKSIPPLGNSGFGPDHNRNGSGRCVSAVASISVYVNAATGFRVSAKDLVVLFQSCPKLVMLLNRYAQELALQVTQVAGRRTIGVVDESEAGPSENRE